MKRLIIPAIAVVLFYLEPVFGLFSPLDISGEYRFLIPRFLIMYLIFISIYYSRNRAMLYALLFGLLYDVFFIDIIGLYSFLYPLICLIASFIVKFIHQHLIVTTALSLVLVAGLEFVLYQFFSLIGLTDISLAVFVRERLIPTMIANSIFLVVLGWAFKYVINARLLQRLNQPN
ncbi:rod shape-determining protein MreD [Paenisporosarcina sp. FSL H8-0542]|uniref:rod shape-determining protein MreD n=1 Tax=unclassified Paenisporosarcina TaxID=2642018 RepID=UPI00034E0371|nr:rod shape-determining protein MreD [Paenisporosarcina sp. HGH0030]EPD54291.1 rod shape-determining protein MreD [Paenisporosarcina sp. HGH0030]